MTILSTDLKALRRRGYNGEFLRIFMLLPVNVKRCLQVDRILKQQQAEREALERARKEQEALLPPKPLVSDNKLIQPLSTAPEASSRTLLGQPVVPQLPVSAPHTSPEKAISQSPHTEAPTPPLPVPHVPTRQFGSVIRSLGNKVFDGGHRSASSAGSSRDYTKPPPPQSHVTPLSNIGTSSSPNSHKPC